MWCLSPLTLSPSNYTYIYIYIYIYIHMYMNINIYHMYVYTYIYVYLYLHMYTCIYKFRVMRRPLPHWEDNSFSMMSATKEQGSRTIEFSQVCCINALNCCVHYVCLRGMVLRRTYRPDYETLFHVEILSKHHHHLLISYYWWCLLETDYLYHSHFNTYIISRIY
jgi:hypothetical protein